MITGHLCRNTQTSNPEARECSSLVRITDSTSALREIHDQDPKYLWKIRRKINRRASASICLWHNRPHYFIHALICDPGAQIHKIKMHKTIMFLLMMSILWLYSIRDTLLGCIPSTFDPAVEKHCNRLCSIGGGGCRGIMDRASDL